MSEENEGTFFIATLHVIVLRNCLSSQSLQALSLFFPDVFTQTATPTFSFSDFLCPDADAQKQVCAAHSSFCEPRFGVGMTQMTVETEGLSCFF